MTPQGSENVTTGPHDPQAAGAAHDSSANATNTSSSASAAQTQNNTANVASTETTRPSTASSVSSGVSTATSGLSMLEMLGMRAPGGTSSSSSHGAQQHTQGPQQATPGPQQHSHNHAGHAHANASHSHSHAGHGGPSCPCCGTNQDDLWFQRCFSDERTFEWAVSTGATHPNDDANASRAQQREQKAQQLSPAQTKAALATMAAATLTFEDSINGMDLVFGRFANMYYRIPGGRAGGTKGKPILAAINLEFLPNHYREDAIGRPAIFSSRLLKLSRAFWQDYFPTPEGAAAVAELTSGSTTFWNATAQKEENLPFMQMKVPNLKFVPASFSGFDWPVLYDLDHGFCWPLIDVSKLNKNDDFIPWQNPKKAKYLAFAPCPVDPFDMGSPRNPQVSMSAAQHPHRVEKMINIKEDKATTFIDRLEKVDTSLLQRMVRVGLGTIALEAAGEEVSAETKNLVVAPCGNYHVFHFDELKAHIMSLDLPFYWRCPSCDKVLQENVGTDESGTQWLVPRPEAVRSLRDEVVRRERARV